MKLHTCLLPVALGLLAAVASACSQSTGAVPGDKPGGNAGNSDSASSPTATAAQCVAACEAKAGECGTPPSVAAQACTSACAVSVSEAQLSCVKSKSCEEVAAAESLSAVCPPSAPVTGTQPGGTDSGTTAPAGKATKIAVSASFGSTKATHLLSTDKTKLISSISISGTPTFTPSTAGELPNIFNAEFTVESPPRDGCTAKITWTLNRTQIAATLTTEDLLPSHACSVFSNAIASDGIQGTFAAAPYPSGGQASIDVKMSP